jgi:hypothetical protein
MKPVISVLTVAAVLVAGCSSTGTLGLATRSMVDPGAVITTAGHYETIGPATGKHAGT